MRADVSEIMKARRIELKMSQAKLAERAGVSVNTIYNLENNRVRPSVDTYIKLCAALDISLSDLLK